MKALKSKLRSIASRALRISGLRNPVQADRNARWTQLAQANIDEEDRLTPQIIVERLKVAGLKGGDTLWLQSSWNTLSPHKINPIELIASLQETVGEDGMIIMPAFLTAKDAARSRINFARAASDTGMLTEIFRRLPGVRRSTQLHGSVCVWGKGADDVVRRHQDCENSFSINSPFEVLLKNDALCVSLGFGRHPTFLTPVHLVEGLEHGTIPALSNSFGEHITYDWIDDQGEQGTSSSRVRKGYVNVKILPAFIGPEHFFQSDYSTGAMVAMRCKDLYFQTKKLAQKRITIYSKSVIFCHFLYLLK